MKKYFLILVLFVLQNFAQRLNFVIVDEIDVRTKSGNDNLVELVNTLNQLSDIDFVVFNELDSNLDNPDELITKTLKKIKFPVYIQPAKSSFWLDKSAREKFMNKFGDLNFRKNYDSLKVIGLNSIVAWSDKPFFERETFSFLQNEKLDSTFTSIVIFNGAPIETKNFDLVEKYFNGSKVKLIAAPLVTRKDFVEGNISVLNTTLNSRKKEVFQIITISEDSLIVKTSDLSGKLNKPNIHALKTNPFEKPKTSFQYDPDKLLKWNFDVGYSIASKPIIYEGKIFVADVSGQVVCIDTLGRKKWDYYSFGYIYSTPTARDGYLAIGTVQGDMETINVKNGKQIQSIGFDSPITTDLTSFEYGGTYNLMLPKHSRSKAAVVAGTQGGILYCYDLETLQELWKFDQPSGAIIGKPIITKGVVLFYSLDGYLYSVNAQTGLISWKTKLTGKNDSNIYASDLTHNSDDVFISLTNGNLFSFDILLGKKNWEYNKYKLFTSLSVSKDGRYIYGKSTNDRFHILSAKLGTWVREIRTMVGNDNTNTEISELGKNIYYGNEEGYLVQINDNYDVDNIFRSEITPLHSIIPLGKNKLLLGYHNGTISLIRIKN